jgi:alpha-beta hydrolase superfamily lysophospholipase
MQVFRRVAVLAMGGAVFLCLLTVAVLAGGLWFSAPRHATIAPAPADLRVEPVTFSSPATATIHGWFLPGQRGGGAVVLLHAMHGNRWSMVRRARFLSRHGFSVLLFDFHAHGESSGDWITFGHLETLDAQAAVAFMRQRVPGEHVGVIGVSLGAAAALLGPAPLPADALVLESVYYDIHHVVANRLRSLLGPLGSMMSALVEDEMQPILGIGLGDLRPIERIRTVTGAVFVLSGTADTRTTIDEARQLYERAPDPKRFWAVEGAGHGDLEVYDSQAYWDHVLPFLVDHLRSTDVAGDSATRLKAPYN